MKINSTAYDYTSLLSAYSAQQRTTASTSSDTSTASAAVESLMKKLAPPDMGSSIMSLSAKGQKVKDSIQRPEPPTEDMKAAMDQVRSDLDTIQSTDVDSLSSDDAKTLLDQLISDMGALPSKTGSTDSTTIDVSALTEDEVKEMLQAIQDKVAKGPGSDGTPPPPPPEMQGMMWGFDPSQLLGTDTSEDTTGISGIESEDMANRLVDLLTEAYDSSSETSSEYVARLKESIAEMLEKQKSSMEDFSATLYAQLDTWSSTVN